MKPYRAARNRILRTLVVVAAIGAAMYAADVQAAGSSRISPQCSTWAVEKANSDVLVAAVR